MLSLILISACSTTPKSEKDLYEDKTLKEVRVMSWNIKRLGRTSLNYASAVDILKEADVIALQEINTKTGKNALEKLGLLLEKEIAERTCEGITEPTSGNGSERYAFIWINSKISLIKKTGEVVTDCPAEALSIDLNTMYADKIDREPGQATFRIKKTKKDFTLVSVHLVPTAKKPETEVPWLFLSVEKNSGVTLVAGDFNLGSSHPVFDKARSLNFLPSFNNEKTSLKMSSRTLNAPYDNIWLKGASVKNTKVINLYERFPGIEQKNIYNEISDHSPITVVLDL